MNNYEFANAELNEETMQKAMAYLVVENADMKKQIKFLTERNETWKKRYDELNEIALSNKTLYEITDEKINKAIEYIKKCQLGVDAMDKPYMLLDQDEGKELLNILKGDNK